jgi:hypothetical protein
VRATRSRRERESRGPPGHMLRREREPQLTSSGRDARAARAHAASQARATRGRDARAAKAHAASQARTTGSQRWCSPLGPAGGVECTARRLHVEETREHAKRHAIRGLGVTDSASRDRAPRRSVRARGDECHACSRATSSSTVAEHAGLADFDYRSKNAPGRPEGRCEHTDLAIPHRRDGRQGVCSDGPPRMGPRRGSWRA